MAYDALSLLARELDWIMDHANRCDRYVTDPLGSCRFCNNLFITKQQIKCLHENVVFLLSFLEGFPREAGKLEARLENAAKRARCKFNHIPSFQDKNDLEQKVVLREREESVQEIDSILQEATRIRSSSQTHPSGYFSSRLASIVGFEKDLIEIKVRLIDQSSSQLQIIPIVGMGGIGKTTLARYVYHDRSTVYHFDVCAWATVSQNSSAIIILSNLLSSIDPSKSEKEYLIRSRKSLVEYGHRYLKKRRYLIVMDDIWDPDVWDDVKWAFPDDCNGSRIIITTRDLDVASYVASASLSQAYHIELLSVDQSWRLLKKGVFGHETPPPELEKIGKLIAEKCRGLPLAIVVIAGVLSNLSQTQESWEMIAGDVFEAAGSSEQYSDILSVSYMHLPRHLRPCFLYMACFPEDHVINVPRLIRLWISEGFLVLDESKDMEELGYEYLEDLVKRSLVLIEKKRYDGKIKAVKIHDVLRDLCLRKARNENSLLIIYEFSGSFPDGIHYSRRLSISTNVWGCIPNMDCSPIHTILMFLGHWAFDYWKDFRLLRVLDAMTVALTSFKFEICELIHLRYLALAFEPQRKEITVHVPEDLSKLQNLQTLVMGGLASLIFTAYLPCTIWRMPQLRHIILPGGLLSDPCTESCQETSPLGNLHTFSYISGFTCSERTLEMLPNLKKLGINYGHWDLGETGWSKFGLNNLIQLPRLEKLRIRAYYYSDNKSNVAQNLAFPVTLKILTLNGCRFPWEDMRIIGSLPNLEVLKLKRNSKCGTTWETTEGEFRQLKVLVVGSEDLEEWITESSHFPRLERLTIYECNSLGEIPDEIGEIPTFELIEVDVRNSCVVQSAKCIQEEQRSCGKDFEVSILKPHTSSYFWKG